MYLSRADSVADITREQIEKDLGRTMPTVALFQTDVSARAVQAAPAVIPNSPSVLQEGLAQLRRILMAYAVRNPDLGCALGLHRIAGPFYRCGISSRVGYSYFAACDSVPHGICSI